MTKKKKLKTTAAKGRAAEKNQPTPKEDAHQTTFVLMGALKRIQLMYLHVGKYLVKMRDLKLYAEMGYPDMVTYARKELGLSRSSLYNYLMVYDWVARKHPEWLEPPNNEAIPDLSDVRALIQIDEELEKNDLTPARRQLLEALEKKGLEGTLTQADARKAARGENLVKSGLKELIKALRRDRMRANALANMSPEVLKYLDMAIQILVNDHALKVAGFRPLQTGDEKWCEKLLA